MIRYSKMNLGTRLVPISELFSFESTFSIIHVLLGQLQMTQLSRHMLCLRCVHACLIIFSNNSWLLYPSHGVHYSTVGNDFCLERVVDSLDFRFRSTLP